MNYSLCAQFYKSYAESAFNSLADQLVEKIELARVETAIDLCTGTGLVLQKLSQRFPSASMLLGVDISSGMLEMAKSKSYSNTQIAWAKMNVEELALSSESFSLVTNHLALHHLNPEKALSEMYRILAPGGILALHVADQSQQSTTKQYGIPSKMFYHFFKKFLTKTPSPELENARIEFNKEYSPELMKELRETSFNFFQPDALSNLARSIGFTNIESRSLNARLTFPDCETFLQFVINTYPYYQLEMREMDKQAEAQLLRAFEINAKKHCFDAQGQLEEYHLIVQLIARKE